MVKTLREKNGSEHFRAVFDNRGYRAPGLIWPRFHAR